MKITFLGTGNASGIPSPFCECVVCELARHVDKRNRRSRTSTMINENLLIDIGPDLVHQMYENQIKLINLEYALITHTHMDHFSFPDLSHKYLGHQKNNQNKLNVYMSKEAYLNTMESINYLSLNSYMSYSDVNVYQLNPFNYYDVINLLDYQIIPIKGNHLVRKLEVSANYMIKSNGKTILYGTDTAFYEEETINYIKQFKFDLLILDCNNGFDDHASKSHMGITDVIKLLDILYANQSINLTTLCYLTHISDLDQNSHEQLEEKISHQFKYQMHVAYDGLIIKI